jgi:hypothetical protein
MPLFEPDEIQRMASDRKTDDSQQQAREVSLAWKSKQGGREWESRLKTSPLFGGDPQEELFK